MKDSIMVKDDFCPQIDEVRQSALDSGFNTLKPNKGLVGSSIYEGMNFVGRHSHLLRCLSASIGRPVYPNNMFFRITTPDMESAYVHSDRGDGDFTCIVYLSKHAEVYGTGFYKHRETGMTEMPTFDAQIKTGIFEQLCAEMVGGSDDHWEQTDFVRGSYNRALIFHAPLFHSRIPKTGLGTDGDTARLIWACHFVL